MSKLDIHKFPDELLRKKTTKVKDPLAKEVQELIKNMFETMRAANGLGLAAPQVGSNLRICVIEEGGKEYILINPQITTRSKTTTVMEEGCLSFPKQFMLVKRPEEVKVRYLDKEGKQCKIKAHGLLARAFQHEIDHLEGILIIDKAKKSKPSNVKIK